MVDLIPSFRDHTEENMGFCHESLDPPSMDYFFQAAESTIQKQKARLQQRGIPSEMEQRSVLETIPSPIRTQSTAGVNGLSDKSMSQSYMSTAAPDVTLLRKSRERYSQQLLGRSLPEEYVEKTTNRLTSANPTQSPRHLQENTRPVIGSNSTADGDRLLSTRMSFLSYPQSSFNGSKDNHQPSRTHGDGGPVGLTHLEHLMHKYRQLQYRALARLPMKNGSGKPTKTTVSQFLNSHAVQRSDDIRRVSSNLGESRKTIPNRSLMKAPQISATMQELSSSVGCPSMSADISLASNNIQWTRMPKATTTNGLISPECGLQSRYGTKRARPTTLHNEQMQSSSQVEWIERNRAKSSQIMVPLEPTGGQRSKEIRGASTRNVPQLVPERFQTTSRSQRIVVPFQTTADNTKVVSTSLEPPREFNDGIKQGSECQERQDEYHYRLTLATNSQNHWVESTDGIVGMPRSSRSLRYHPQLESPVSVNDQNIVSYTYLQPPRVNIHQGRSNSPGDIHHIKNQNDQPSYPEFRKQCYGDECNSEEESDIAFSTISTFRKPGKPLLDGVLPDFSEMFPDWRSRRQSFQRRTKGLSKGRCGC